MAGPLPPEYWQAIKTIWEFDPDQPGFVEAAERAAKEYVFDPPSKQAIHQRAKKQGWERRGSMVGIVAAAQRKADTLVQADGSPEPPPEPPEPVDDPAIEAVHRAMSAREEAEDKRAEVLARHRQEWREVAVLRDEAINARLAHLGAAYERGRLAKILAETTAIKQAGERKAWGLDEVPVDPKDLKSKSDADLLAIVAGNGRLSR